MTTRLLRWFVPLVACAGLLAQIEIYRRGLAEQPIRSDGISYHVYLPSLVLHGSPRLWPVADDQYGGAFPEHTGILRWPNTSWWLNPHPIGAAVFMLPFFLIAHALTLWSNLPPDGFSLYYQIGASLSGLVWGVAGLAILQRILQRHVPAAVTLATLVVITLGTNLFHYLTFDATYSHAYGVFLVAALLWATERFWTQPGGRAAIHLGAVVGLLFLVRHSHLLLALVPALYRPASLWSARRHLLIAAAVALAVAVPQLAIYKAVTGSWIVSPYSLLPATMRFDAPHITGILFWFPKGLFLWSPLLLMAMAGLALRHPLTAGYRAAALITFTLFTWLIGSWYDWQFGGSFGHRGYTDLLPLLALPLAAAFDRLRDASRPVRGAVTAVVTLLVVMSIGQMLLYWAGAMPFRDVTWPEYLDTWITWR